ncbi:MAG: protein O-mannosyl-transferase family [Candidatus Goldiibacteriota bacterium]
MRSILRDNSKALITAGIFIAFFGIYLSSMPPAFNSDDSPETLAAFYTLGIQHPPGYPLNTLLGKISLMFPAGAETFRANLSAVFWGTASAFMICLLFAAIGGRSMRSAAAGLLSAAVFLYGGTAWLQFINVKGSIYALNAFLTVSLIWALVMANRKTKYFYLAAFLTGLSMCNHWTSTAVLGPGIIFYTGYLMYEKKIRLKHILHSVFFFAAGCSVYLFVFIRSAAGPAYAWGDIKSFGDFKWLFSRSQYAGAETAHNFGHTIDLLVYYVKNMFVYEYPYYTAAVFFAGVYYGLKKRMFETVFFLICYFSVVISVASFATPPENTQWLIKPYLVASNIYPALFAGLAVLFIPRMKGMYEKIILPAALCAVIVFFAAVNNPGYSRYFIGYDYGRNISRTIEKESVVFAEGDMNVGAVLYESHVKKEDFVPVASVVFLYDWYRKQLERNYGEKIQLPPNSGNMRNDIEKTVKLNSGKNIYYTSVYTEEWVKNLLPEPAGVINRIITSNRPMVVSDNRLKLYSFRGIADNSSGYDEFTDRLVLRNYATAYFKLGDILRINKAYSAAAVMYEKGLVFYRSGSVYTNIGLCGYFMGDLSKAEAAWKKALEYEPDSSINLTNMAHLYIAKNDRETAMKYIRRALEISPENAKAKELYKAMQ